MGTLIPGEDGLSPEITKLTKALAKDPKSKLFMPLAEEYVKIGMLEDAVAVLENGLKHYPTFVTARVALGRLYFQLENGAKARTMLEEATKLSPENLLAHKTLARVYERAGAVDLALASCAVVLAANARDEDILSLKSSLEQRSASTPAPQKDLADTVALDREKPEAAEGHPSGEASPTTLDERADKVARLQAWLAQVQQRRA